MNDQIRNIETEIGRLREELAKARAAADPTPVSNYTFQTRSGPVALSELFGEREDLLIIHNMGRSCPYCTLWADGFSGYLRHLEQRAAFVLVSPDAPEVQMEVSAERGWQFRMAQDATRDFSRAMGVYTEKEGWWPGVSGFHRQDDGTIVRTGFTVFGPGDDFCLVWPMFELLAGGANGWEPR